MYWKAGFYDTPITGGVEISVEYWQELIEGNSVGKLIVENSEGYPVLVDYKATVDEIRAQKLVELHMFDASEEVNQFSINDVSGWLNKSTRFGLMNSINIEKEVGKADTTIWLGDVPFVFSIEKAIEVLHQVELYALACHDTTQRHIRAINQLDTKEGIAAYDFRAGYPGKLNFAG